MRGGLHGVDPQLNRQVSATQQALAFLDRAGTQLQDLNDGLTLQLARRQHGLVTDGGDTGKLEQQVRDFDDLWSERPKASAGTLDNQLGYNAAGDARQKFSARGLQLESLRAGDRETLKLSVGNGSQKVASVVVEPGLSDTALVQRFDRALAPSGIRAQRNAQGDLSFNVAETAWPTVRESLTIRGEGRRFPTGQFNRLRLAPEESAIRPQDWNVTDAAATRRMLQQVRDAQHAVGTAQTRAGQALADMSDRVAPQAPDKAQAETQWAAEFTQTFEATAGRGDYQVMSAVTPALLGISRDRVVALLGPVAR
jgi:hypothetical protein